MYPVPKKMSLSEFKYLLTIVEYPWYLYSTGLPSSRKTATMPIVVADDSPDRSPQENRDESSLYTPHELPLLPHTRPRCNLVLNLAKNRLREIWDSHSPPSASPSSSTPNPNREHPIVASHAIHLAREHSVPGVLKRMPYDMLSSSVF